MHTQKLAETGTHTHTIDGFTGIVVASVLSDSHKKQVRLLNLHNPEGKKKNFCIFKSLFQFIGGLG